MKFPQLPVGARFRFQGEDYCKTSPLAASGADGAQRMIPRSALVEPLLDDAKAAKKSPATPLHKALNRYHAECRTLLQEAVAGGPATLKALEHRLEQAHAELLATMD